jgi:hypothetical protein
MDGEDGLISAKIMEDRTITKINTLPCLTTYLLEKCYVILEHSLIVHGNITRISIMN